MNTGSKNCKPVCPSSPNSDSPNVLVVLDSPNVLLVQNSPNGYSPNVIVVQMAIVDMSM